MRSAALVALLLTATVVAGCTQPPAQPVTPPAGDGGTGGTGGTGAGNNTTRVYLPPVARMQVFDTDGALVYEANFVAEDARAGSAVQGGGEVRFVGSTSEAVDKTATLEAWNWEFSGPGMALRRQTGRSVAQAFPDTGGIFKVKLTVTDSHGLSDSLNLTLGVHATRTFTEPITGSGALQVGTLGNAAQAGVDTAEQPLELLGNVQGFTVEVERMVLNVTAGEQTSDFDLTLLDAEGEVVDRSAARAPGGMEELTFGPGELSAGTYTARIVLYAGVNGTYTVAGEVVYRVINPDVAEQFGGHSH